jgi:aminoglycoside phosphotransferase (APT) family kinase protein
MEFGVIKALHGSGVPVPEVFWLEEDPGPLGAPFFALAEITGCETSGSLFATSAYRDARAAIAQDKWSILGRLARLDPDELGLTGLLPCPAPDEVWRRELDFWEAMVEDNRQGPQPITSATIRHLRRNPPPPPARLAIVHGDFRTGNFLFAADGRVHGILDWEMAHLGDPLEDLAYSLSRQWAMGNGDLRGNLAPLDQAIAHWEQASGMRADPQALHWWRLFSTVKCQGLWASGAAGWRSGLNRDMVMVMAAWSCGATHEREALELMDRL